MNQKKKKFSQNSRYLKINTNIISVFFVLYLMVFCMICLRYLPNFYATSVKDDLFKSKYNIKYFSHYFSKQGITQVSVYITQLIMCFDQILFFVIAFNLSTLIKQRISVPELQREKGNYFLLILSLLSISFSYLVLVFFNDSTLYITIHFLKLTDNVFFLLFLMSSYIFCLDTFYFLNKFDISTVPKESYYINIKMYLLAIMGITILQYIFCLLLVSYYTPIIYIEKLLTSTLIILKEINSILFILSFLLFVVSIKYDMFYLYLDLNTRPDIEYFVEEKEEEASKLIK